MRYRLPAFLPLFMLSLTPFFGQAQDYKFSLDELNGYFADPLLTDPRSAFPHWQSLSDPSWKLLKMELTCKITQEDRNKHDQFDPKHWQWVQFQCSLVERLDPDFFKTPPYLHPSGRSWVALAWQSGKIEKDKQQWIADHWSFGHWLELAEFDKEMDRQQPIIEVLRDFTPDHIQQLRNGEDEILLPHFRLVKSDSNTGPLEYYATRRLWPIWLESRAFLFTTLGFLVLLLVFSAWLAWRLWALRRQNQKNRDLMMQTIAHEMRHPVSSLQLSLEVLRESFDQLPEPVQTEFLRMTGQVQRTLRIIKASGDYLHSTQSPDKSFQFTLVSVDSLREFVFDIMKDYQNKITLTYQGENSPFRTDPYWLSVCLINLVKNALVHGLPPIEVSGHLERSLFTFTVTDQGSAKISEHDFFQAFQKDKRSSGMGLGLSIVKQVVTMMGGSIHFSDRPTRFQLIIREITND